MGSNIYPEFQNKVVLVTGANHGIGAATAKIFASCGAGVFITYLRVRSTRGFKKNNAYTISRAKGPEKIMKEIRRLGAKTDSLEIDLAEPNNICRLFDRVEKSLGSVDILVNNAAFWEPDSLESVTPESHDKHFAINSRATVLMMAEYFKRHKLAKKGWGRIINISTDCASCDPVEISYAASKHAMESFSRSAATELGKYGITVNIIAPGPIQTGYLDKKAAKREIGQIPLKRLGSPDDIAKTVLFLASKQADFITGQLLYVGGGKVMPL